MYAKTLVFKLLQFCSFPFFCFIFFHCLFYISFPSSPLYSLSLCLSLPLSFSLPALPLSPFFHGLRFKGDLWTVVFAIHAPVHWPTKQHPFDYDPPPFTCTASTSIVCEKGFTCIIWILKAMHLFLPIQYCSSMGNRKHYGCRMFVSFVQFFAKILISSALLTFFFVFVISVRNGFNIWYIYSVADFLYFRFFLSMKQCIPPPSKPCGRWSQN